MGLSEDALTALQKGIGVSTTRARLQHLFGADYRFEFHRQPSRLSVVVAIPWQIEVKTRTEHTNRLGGTQSRYPGLAPPADWKPQDSITDPRTHSAFT